MKNKIIHNLKLNKKGFTLVEAICSIAILAIASLTFALFVGTSTKLIAASVRFENDREQLIQALETHNADGLEVEVVDDKKNSYNVKFSKDDTFTINGDYITVKSKETGKSYTIFVGKSLIANTKLQNPTDKLNLKRIIEANNYPYPFEIPVINNNKYFKLYIQKQDIVTINGNYITIKKIDTGKIYCIYVGNN